MAESEGGGSGGSGTIRELLAVFGFAVDQKELKKGETGLSKFAEKVKKISEGIVAAFAVEQVYEFAEGQAKAMNAIERTGTQLGISTDRVQEFRFAAQSLGLEADSLLNSMGRLQVSQQAAASGSKAQTEAFRSLGLSVSELKGKSADELMLSVADGVSKISDPSKQAAIAVSLFGRSGRELLPFLKDGREGAEELFATFRESGGGYTEEAMKSGRDFDRQQAKTNLAITSVKNTIAKSLLPMITAISKGVASAAKWFSELAKNSNIVQSAMIALGIVATGFAIRMAIAFAPVLLTAAAIAALVLAIDDLYTFLTGGESEIGDLIDKIFGKGAQVEVVSELKREWSNIKDIFESLAVAVEKVWGMYKKILDKAEKVGGVIGDFAGKQDFGEGGFKYERAKKFAAQNRSGLSYEQNVAKQQAQLMLEAKDSGMEFHPTEIPAAFKGHEDAFMRDVQSWAGQLKSGVQLPSGIMGPSNSPSNVNSVSVAVNVPPGLNEKQVGEHVAKQVGEVLKQKTREAAATVPRAGG